MRRPFLALAFAAVLATPAAAQYPAGPDNQSSLALVAPTAPTTDSSNRIATTAWVNNWLASAMPLAAGKIWIGSAGNIATPQTPSGDLTVSNGGVFTFGTVNSNVGSFGSATLCATVTVNAKGLITAASAATCTPAVGSITGLGTGIATWLGSPSSANLRAALTDETGTGLAYFQGGDIGTPSAGVGTNLTALNASNISTGTLPTARLSLGQLTNSLGADVLLNNISNFFDGPSIAQGSTGTWWASGTATVQDTAGTATIFCKLWDGTTTISSALGTIAAASGRNNISLSGFITSPAGNIRISCQDGTSTSGRILFNASGTSKDSTVSAFRIQ